MEALIYCAIQLVVFGIMALFGLKPKERRALEGRPEENYEYAHKERVS